ncbi:MAG: hypothetical protein ABSH01_17450 [Terriglobia bacterium]
MDTREVSERLLDYGVRTIKVVESLPQYIALALSVFLGKKQMANGGGKQFEFCHLLFAI